MSRSNRKVWVFIGIVIVLTSLWWHLHRSRTEADVAGRAVRHEELPESGPPDGRLRIATWNIRQFPEDRGGRPLLASSERTNLTDLRISLGALRADLWGFAEITRPQLLASLLHPSMKMVVGSEAGPSNLHAVLAWRSDALELVNQDSQPRALGRPLERSVGAYLRSRNGGLDLSVLQVHLRAHPRAYSYRLEQYEQIAAWVERVVQQTGDGDVIVMGDLNTTGPEGGTTADELEMADRILGRVGLRRLENITGCTEYWEGPGPPDGRLVASTLDHVYMRALTELAADVPLQAWLHCRRADCQELISRPGQEDGTFWDLSDHCPLTFAVEDRDHDPPAEPAAASEADSADPATDCESTVIARRPSSVPSAR